jgi:hypothetical protein
MCTISFEKEALDITIYNQYPGLELVSPVYCSNGTTCHVSPSQQVDTSAIMEASFGIDSGQEGFDGILLYKLQRKYTIRPDNQPNSGTTSIEDIATNIHLLVTWNIKDYECRFHVCLIEYDDDFTWDEDKLWRLRWKYGKQLRNNYNSSLLTWLMNDNTFIKTKLKITYETDYKLDIIVSEGTGKYIVKRPMKIDPKRLVLPLHMSIMLMYASRLCIQPLIKLNIHNQCFNINFVSPVYITDSELECYMPPDYKVCTGDIMRSGFAINESGNGSGAALICKLQKKQPHKSIEIGENTSNTVYLLVVWRISKFNELYADVLLVEHNKGFDWNGDNLEKLYRENISRFRLYPVPVVETWLLDDNTALMTMLEVMNGGQLLNVIISEVEKHNYVRRPAHTNPER